MVFYDFFHFSNIYKADNASYGLFFGKDDVDVGDWMEYEDQ